MSTQDDLDFLDDDNAMANTHDLAQDYLSTKQTSGASRWLVPLFLVIGVGTAGAGVWFFYLHDMLFPSAAAPLSSDAAMGIPPTINDTALTPNIIAPTEMPTDTVPNTAQDTAAAQNAAQNAAMGIPPMPATSNNPVTPSAATTAPMPTTAPVNETDANFAPPLTPEKTDMAAAMPKTEVLAPAPDSIVPKIEAPESIATEAQAEPEKISSKDTKNDVTSEELITPAMPTPTALPTSEVKPAAEKTAGNPPEVPSEKMIAMPAAIADAAPIAVAASEAPAKEAKEEVAVAINKEEPTAQQAEILLLRDQMRALTEAVDKVKTAKTETTTPANTEQFAAKAAVDKLNQQLADLTTKLDTINQRTETLMQTAQNNQNNAIEAKTPTTTEVVEKPAEKAEIKTLPKIVAKPKPKPAYKPAPRVVAKKPTVPAVRKATWQLRSASPGVAGLAKNGGSEIQTFVVGDTVPGFGRVTAVQTDASGQWVVLTTGGTIHQ